MTKNARNFIERIKNVDASAKQKINTDISVLKSIAQRYDEVSEHDLVTEYLNAIEKTVLKAKEDYLQKTAS